MSLLLRIPYGNIASHTNRVRMHTHIYYIYIYTIVRRQIMKGISNCKLLMTEVEGSIFAIYTSLLWFIYNNTGILKTLKIVITSVGASVVGPNYWLLYNVITLCVYIYSTFNFPNSY